MPPTHRTPEKKETFNTICIDLYNNLITFVLRQETSHDFQPMDKNYVLRFDVGDLFDTI